MKWLLSSLLLMTLSLPAIGNEKGNGGDAVVCRDAQGNIISAELLDYYEGRVLRNLPVIYGEDGDSEELYRLIGRRLNKIDPHVFVAHDQFGSFESYAIDLSRSINEYLSTGANRNREIIFTHEPLIDIPDSGELILKRGCTVEQVAIRLDSNFEEDPHFIFQADILRKMSKVDVRGLVLHEILYWFMKGRSQRFGYEMPNSIYVRYMHQKLMSQDINKYRFRDYVWMLLSDLLIHKRGTSNIYVSDMLFSVLSMQKFNEERIKMTDISRNIVFIMDHDGKIDLELTRKHGAVIVDLFVGDANKMRDSGTLSFKSGGHGGAWLFGEGSKNYSRPLPFGEINLKLLLNFDVEGTNLENEYGIQYNSRWGAKTIRMKATPTSTYVNVLKSFRFSLNDEYNLIYTAL